MKYLPTLHPSTMKAKFYTPLLLLFLFLQFATSAQTPFGLKALYENIGETYWYEIRLYTDHTATTVSGRGHPIPSYYTNCTATWKIRAGVLIIEKTNCVENDTPSGFFAIQLDTTPKPKQPVVIEKYFIKGNKLKPIGQGVYYRKRID